MKTMSWISFFCFLGLAAVSSARGWQGNAQNTYGYSLMTPEERLAHQQKMHSMQTLEECRKYVAEHHKQMVERAQQHNLTLPQMMVDPCLHMQRRGRMHMGPASGGR